MSKTNVGYTEEEKNYHQEKATKLFNVLMTIPTSEFISAVELNPRKFYHETNIEKMTTEAVYDNVTLFNFDMKVDHQYAPFPKNFKDVPIPVLLCLYAQLKNNGYDLAMYNNQTVFGK